ncbi:hypothetical protein V3C99_005868, partial [Haemonchus contortus]
ISQQLISCNPSPHFQVLFPLNLTCKTVPGFRVHRSNPRMAEWLRDDLQADWNACRRVAHLPVPDQCSSLLMEAAREQLWAPRKEGFM